MTLGRIRKISKKHVEVGCNEEKKRGKPIKILKAKEGEKKENERN